MQNSFHAAMAVRAFCPGSSDAFHNRMVVVTRTHGVFDLLTIADSGPISVGVFHEPEPDNVKWSHLFGQVCSVSKVYRVWVSCCLLFFQARPICVVGRLPIKRRMGPLVVVECHPVFDDPSGLEAIADLFEIDRLLL